MVSLMIYFTKASTIKHQKIDWQFNKYFTCILQFYHLSKPKKNSHNFHPVNEDYLGVKDYSEDTQIVNGKADIQNSSIQLQN